MQNTAVVSGLHECRRELESGPIDADGVINNLGQRPLVRERARRVPRPTRAVTLGADRESVAKQLPVSWHINVAPFSVVKGGSGELRDIFLPECLGGAPPLELPLLVERHKAG